MLFFKALLAPRGVYRATCVAQVKVCTKIQTVVTNLHRSRQICDGLSCSTVGLTACALRTQRYPAACVWSYLKVTKEVAMHGSSLDFHSLEIISLDLDIRVAYAFVKAR